MLFREGTGTPLQYPCLENPMDGEAWWATVHGVTKNQTRLNDFTFHFHALEKEVATHSSVLALRIPGTGEPGGLLSVGSHRVGHDWSDLAAVKAMVFPVVMYGCESWTIKKAERWRIDAFVFFYTFSVYLFISILLYNTVLVLPYIDMNPPWVLHEFPILKPPPTFLPVSSLWVIPVHQPQASCILYRT